MDVSSIDEFALIARLTAGLTARDTDEVGVGDDCAVLDLGGERLLLATCDSQVEGVHFTLQTSSPQQIGRKALAVNLSDIAAMGGEPRYALVSLLLPARLPLDALDGIYAGLRAEAEQYATAIVGGNISGTGKSEQLVIDITLLGQVERGHVLRRDGAQPGDLLCVTGKPGESAAGLYTLLHPDLMYERDALESVQRAHCEPIPRIAAGRVLSHFGPAVVTSMLDISDGLSGDLGHICERSHVGARVDYDRLPLSPALRSIAANASQDPAYWTLHGGEDYELLFTIVPDRIEEVISTVYSASGTPVTVIGSMQSPENGMQLRYPDGRLEPLAIQSWNHLKH